MNIDRDSLEVLGLPQFLTEAQDIKKHLQSMTESQLQALWKCNDSIAKLNFERLKGMDLEKSLTPAILSYEGIQFQYMSPGVFEDKELAFLQEHLRILSGFYGMLRPLDGIVPYRLEMQAKFSIGQKKNLYEYWGDRLAKQLIQETDFILNLASKEYSKAVTSYLHKDANIYTCIFGEVKNEKIIEKGTMCKIARGEMVRFLTENQITKLEGIKDFNRTGFTYSEEYSREKNLVFIKGGK